VARANEDVWNDLIREVGERRDGVGMGIDPGIRDVVAGLWGHDVWTAASCQGHDDRGCPMPWVEIEGPWPAPSIRGLGIEERERWRI